MNAAYPLKNDLILRTLNGGKVERPPVWLMRQAGRFLTEYKEVRARAGSFQNMIAYPEFAAEVTLQPVDILQVDAAIIFSDILVIPEAMGLPYEMNPGEGPFFPNTIRSVSDIDKLRPAEDAANLEHTYEAIRMVKQELYGRVPLIGFAGAPWTIFCYMTEGGGSKSFSKAKSIMYREPAMAHRLLDLITDATIFYLQNQVAAGADLIQIFDSWAELLDGPTYRAFSLPYIRRICEALPHVPRIVFPKGAFFALPDFQHFPCEGVGLDWHTNPSEIADLLPEKVLQGNLDPSALYAHPDQVRQMTQNMMRSFPQGKHIVNLGHGLHPDTPRESVLAFVETVRSSSFVS